MKSLVGKQSIIIFPYVGKDGTKKEASAKIHPDCSDWWCSVLREGTYFDIHYCEDYNTINVYQVGLKSELFGQDACIHTITIDPALKDVPQNPDSTKNHHQLW